MPENGGKTLLQLLLSTRNCKGLVFRAENVEIMDILEYSYIHGWNLSYEIKIKEIYLKIYSAIIEYKQLLPS